jgi:transcription initiation factor TFIID subunit TAF12
LRSESCHHRKFYRLPNAALVEETASASQSMGEQARELQELMGFFKLDARRARAYS